MEYEGLGARCTLQSCRTLDYLPYTCPNCKNQYCDVHKTPSSHFCTAPSPSNPTPLVPTCPLCQAPVPIPRGVSPDVVLSRHIDAGCPKRARANPRCAFEGCGVRDHAATKCPTCSQVFCLQHRLEADHVCPRRDALPYVSPFAKHVPLGREARKAVKEKEAAGMRAKKAAKTVPKRPGSRRTDISNSLETAIGDANVPREERVYVAMFFPNATNLPAKYMYFSKRNSAGRLIDRLRKDNPSLPAPPAGQRYALYAVKSHGNGVNLLPYITPLRDLPPSVLQSGDMLVLEVGENGLDAEWVSALRKVSMPVRKKGKSDKCTIS